VRRRPRLEGIRVLPALGILSDILGTGVSGDFLDLSGDFLSWR
jgi:hypothetical protein